MVMPLVKPGEILAGGAVFPSLISWRSSGALTLVNKTRMRTCLRHYHVTYLGRHNYDWGRVVAAGRHSHPLPDKSLSFKYMIAGLTTGGSQNKIALKETALWV